MKNLGAIENEEEQNKVYSIGKSDLLIEDSESAGLERIIIDRNSFFRSEKIVDYIKDKSNLKIYGAVLGFLIVNESLVKAIKDNVRSGGTVEFLMSHPNSDTTKTCEKEDQWHGKLLEILNKSIKKTLEIKNENPENVSLHLSKSAMYNTMISTEDSIIVSPYVFGKRGWYAPTLIFSKNNPTVVSAFDEQLDEMRKYGESNPNTFTEIKNEEDFKNI